MPIREFTTSRLRKANYDPATRQLDLHWQGGNVTAYKPVPEEVFWRLCAAPNPATYWEDRIAEEYPKVRPMAGARQGGEGKPKDLKDLFGGLPEED
ncbi:MAG: KTSC domain-containing protein [Burkholderiales bacterium]|nr:KTSC domain-containing protein [Burkholderiales bacterium]